MSGGYSRIRLDPISVVDGSRDAEKAIGKFDGGLETEMSPLDMPLNNSPVMHCCRILDGYLLPDWGSIELGAEAIGNIQSLGTRQDGTGLLDVPEIFRVFFNGGMGVFQLEIYDPITEDWVAGANFPGTFTPNLVDRIAHETFLDDVIFAAGTEEIQVWDGATITAVSGVSADYIAQFADRAILLRAGGDFQRLRASRNGIYTDFVGAGSQDVILESRTTLDEVDALVALVPLSSDIAALFRAQSIWRVTRTGSGQAPLSFNPWIDGVGMSSSWGAQSVPGGIIFEGSDHYDYLLTEGGLTQLGKLYTRPQGTLRGGSEAIYIPGTGEFRINRKITSLLDQGVHTLHYTEYLRSGNPIWVFRDEASTEFGNALTMRNPTVARPPGLGTSTDPLLIYSAAGTGSVFRFLVPTSGGALQEKVFGHWDSATINRNNRFSSYSIRRLVVRIRQFYVDIGVTPTISIFASVDGGRTYLEAQDSPKNINVINPVSETGHKRIAFHWLEDGDTGYDIRFRVILSDGISNIGLDSWEAELVDRGDQYIPAAGDDG